MPQSTELSKVDAKHGNERIFTSRRRVHVGFYRMPKSTVVRKTDAKKQVVKNLSEL